MGRRLLERLTEVRDDEVGALLWACAYFFFLFGSYFVLRPVRDEMAAAGGVRALPWLFTATLLATLAVHPIHAAIVSRLPRRRFVPLVYELFAVMLIGFWLLLRNAPDGWMVWIGRGFYVWLSVFNLFVVSVFWSYMSDVFKPEQAKRLFGPIAVGGTFGGIAGSAAASWLAAPLGPTNLLLVAFAALQVAVLAALRLAPAVHANDHDAVIGGRAVDGAVEVLRSPFLLGICGYMLLYTITSTFLYFQKMEIVTAVIADRAARTSFFANIDLAVNVLTAFAQIFLTGHVLRRLGVGIGLVTLPLVTFIGFIGLGAVPTLAVVAVFEVLRRAVNYAVARPGREVLYTAVGRDERFKAKHLIDTFIYRTGDQIGAWTSALVTWLGAGVVGLAAVAAPVAAAWAVLALWLGRRYVTRVEAAEAPPPT